MQEDIGTLWAGVEGLREEGAGPRKAGRDSGSSSCARMMLRFQAGWAGAKGSIQEREGEESGTTECVRRLVWHGTPQLGLCRGCAAGGREE